MGQPHQLDTENDDFDRRAYVRFGSKADIGLTRRSQRFLWLRIRNRNQQSGQTTASSVNTDWLSVKIKQFVSENYVMVNKILILNKILDNSTQNFPNLV